MVILSVSMPTKYQNFRWHHQAESVDCEWTWNLYRSGCSWCSPCPLYQLSFSSPSTLHITPLFKQKLQVRDYCFQNSLMLSSLGWKLSFLFIVSTLYHPLNHRQKRPGIPGQVFQDRLPWKIFVKCSSSLLKSLYNELLYAKRINDRPFF